MFTWTSGILRNPEETDHYSTSNGTLMWNIQSNRNCNSLSTNTWIRIDVPLQLSEDLKMMNLLAKADRLYLWKNTRRKGSRYKGDNNQMGIGKRSLHWEFGTGNECYSSVKAWPLMTSAIFLLSFQNDQHWRVLRQAKKQNNSRITRISAMLCSKLVPAGSFWQRL